MPSTAGIVASGSAQLDQWLRANLIAFDERRSNPLVNLGTLGAAGNATATGTRRLVNTGTKAFVWLPGVTGNSLSVADPPQLAGATELDVSVPLLDEDWSPGANLILVGQSTNGSAANTSALFYLSAAGNLVLVTSDGTSTTAAVSSAVVPLVDGTVGCLRATWRASDGRVQFFTKTSTADAALADAALTTGWTQLGTNQTGRTTPLANVTTVLSVGAYGSGANALSATLYGAHVATTIDGAPFLTVDPSVLTDEGATSFTATTGQPVTINRGTGTGYRTEVVLPGCASRLFNGTSDHLEVADNDALDFSAAQSFSVWALIRTWGTSASSNALVSKKASSGFAVGNGYVLRYTNTFGQAVFNVSDGTNGPFAVPATNHTSGQLALLGGVRSVAVDQLTATLNDAAGTAATDTTTATIANSEAVRFGRLSGSGTNYVTTRLYAWGIYPGALTAAQWAALRDALLVPERAAA